MRQAKIIATVGPASSDPAVLARMARAGMDVARLNFSHGTYQDHRRAIRAASRRIAPAAPSASSSTSRARACAWSSPRSAVRLAPGAHVLLTSKGGLGTSERIPIDYSGLMRDISIGDRVLIDDGKVELRVVKKAAAGFRCRVVTGGRISDHKGVNFPGQARLRR